MFTKHLNIIGPDKKLSGKDVGTECKAARMYLLSSFYSSE
jgi:hypothetical protein